MLTAPVAASGRSPACAGDERLHREHDAVVPRNSPRARFEVAERAAHIAGSSDERRGEAGRAWRPRAAPRRTGSHVADVRADLDVAKSPLPRRASGQRGAPNPRRETGTASSRRPDRPRAAPARRDGAIGRRVVNRPQHGDRHAAPTEQDAPDFPHGRRRLGKELERLLATYPSKRSVLEGQSRGVAGRHAIGGKDPSRHRPRGDRQHAALSESRPVDRCRAAPPAPPHDAPRCRCRTRRRDAVGRLHHRRGPSTRSAIGVEDEGNQVAFVRLGAVSRQLPAALRDRRRSRGSACGCTAITPPHAAAPSATCSNRRRSRATLMSAESRLREWAMPTLTRPAFLTISPDPTKPCRRRALGRPAGGQPDRHVLLRGGGDGAVVGRRCRARRPSARASCPAPNSSCRITWSRRAAAGRGSRTAPRCGPRRATSSSSRTATATRWRAQPGVVGEQPVDASKAFFRQLAAGLLPPTIRYGDSGPPDLPGALRLSGVRPAAVQSAPRAATAAGSRARDGRTGLAPAGASGRARVAESRERRRGATSSLLRISRAAVRGSDPCATWTALPPDETSWLAGLRDPVVSRALALLHREPARAWSLTRSRARPRCRDPSWPNVSRAWWGRPRSSTSRAGGCSWRRRRAPRRQDGRQRRPRRSDNESEGPAFSRAFKNVVGTPPRPRGAAAAAVRGRC